MVKGDMHVSDTCDQRPSCILIPIKHYTVFQYFIARKTCKFKVCFIKIKFNYCWNNVKTML
jgi:hypothetical protein